MRTIKKLIIVLLISSFSSNISANTRPDSFADLAERLMPSVVNAVVASFQLRAHLNLEKELVGQSVV